MSSSIAATATIDHARIHFDSSGVLPSRRNPKSPIQIMPINNPTMRAIKYNANKMSPNGTPRTDISSINTTKGVANKTSRPSPDDLSGAPCKCCTTEVEKPG